MSYSTIEKDVILLGDLRAFINEDCKLLDDNVPITINAIIDPNDTITYCKQIIADEASVEFYNY